MRLKNLIIGDIQFQAKYGFYLLYVVLTIFYIAILYALPLDWKKNAVTIIIFSDPAALGLFFMGAIVLLEKSQRVIHALAVSPIKITEYIISKVVTLGIVSVAVAFTIALAARIEHIVLLLLGTALTAAIFTLIGIIIATKITSLNQFVIVTVLIEIIVFVPVLFHLLASDITIMRFYPISLCIDLIAGNTENILFSIFIIVCTIALLGILAYDSTLKMWRSFGGVRVKEKKLTRNIKI